MRMKTFVSTVIVVLVIFLLNIENQCESAAIDTTIKEKIYTTFQSNQTGSEDEKDNQIKVDKSLEDIPRSSVHAAHICPRGKSFIKGECLTIFERENINIEDIALEATVSNETTIKEEKSEPHLTVEAGTEKFITVTAAIGKTAMKILESDQVIIIEEAQSFLAKEPVTEEESITPNTDVEKSTREVFELDQKTVIGVKDLQFFLTEEPVTEESITTESMITNAAIEEATTKVECLESIKIATTEGDDLQSFLTKEFLTEDSIITTTAAIGKAKTEILESDQVIIIGGEEAQSIFIKEPVTEGESITPNTDVDKSTTEFFELDQKTVIGVKDLQFFLTEEPVTEQSITTESITTNAAIEETTTEVECLESIIIGTTEEEDLQSLLTKELLTEDSIVTTTAATGKTTKKILESDQVIIRGGEETQYIFIKELVTEEPIATNAAIIKTTTEILKLDQVTTLGYKDLQGSFIQKRIADHILPMSNAAIQETTTEILESDQVTTDKENEREYSLANGKDTTTSATIADTTTFTFRPDQVTTNKEESNFDDMASWFENMSEEIRRNSFNVDQEISGTQKQLQTSSTVKPGTDDVSDEDEDMAFIDFEDFIFRPSPNKICPDGMDLILDACRRTL